MPRRKLEDVLPPDGRSIRNVPIRRERNKDIVPPSISHGDDSSVRSSVPVLAPQEPVMKDALRDETYIEQMEEVREENERPPASGRGRYGKRNVSGRFVLWGFVGVAVLFLIFSVLLLFTGATVTVVLKEVPATLDGNFTAGTTQGKDALVYEVMTVSDTRQKEISATGREQVDTKASGTIIVYNAFSETGQRLIKNTRFESPDGRIYRIDSSVVVPGYTKNSDGSTVPGSIEVVVYADFPGEDYNADMLDFTIPGLKNDPREELMYARSKTAMIGGFSGVRNVADKKDVESAREALRKELRDSALVEATAQVPEGYILFNDATAVTFESVPERASGSDIVVVEEKIIVHGILFNVETLGAFIARELIPDFDGGTVVITNIDSLDFSINEKNAGRIAEGEDISIAFSGTPHIRWMLDEEALKADLAGTAKEDVNAVLKFYPAIEEAKVVIRPFWKGYFPDRPNRIKIIEKAS